MAHNDIEIECILRTYQVSGIIRELPPSQKDFKHDLKPKMEDLSLEDLANSLQIEEEFCKQENTKLFSRVNFVKDGHSKKRVC